MAWTDVSWIAVFIAAVANMMLGAAWYGVLEKPWMALALPGRSKEDIVNASKPGYVVAIIASLMTATALAVAFDALGTATLAGALGVGVIVWIGFVATSFGSSYAFSLKPAMLYVIDSGYFLVSLVLMSMIINLVPW